MGTPSYNGSDLFSGTDYLENTITEGVLIVGAYFPIIQDIHFEGERGNRYLTHGTGDRIFTFKGLLSAKDVPTMVGYWNAIQDEIDNFNNAPSSYYQTLVDSFGNTFDNAQIHKMQYPTWHWASENNYTSTLEVSGIICSMVQDNAS